MSFVFEMSKLAQEDLENIWFYTLQNWSLSQANKYYNLIIAEIQSICNNPEIGKAIEEVKSLHKNHQIQFHLIVYKIERDKIWIDRILHKRMDIESKLID